MVASYLRLTPSQIDTMVNHAKKYYPQEVCGLIAGEGERVTLILPLPNVDTHPKTHFMAAPDALLSAYRRIEEIEGYHLIGIYHSHPHSDPIPSKDDIHSARLNTPNLAHVIISLNRHKPALKAWRITPEQRVMPVELVTGQQTPSQNVSLTQAQKCAIIVAIILALLILWSISFTLLPPAPPIPTPAS